MKQQKEAPKYEAPKIERLDAEKLLADQKFFGFTF